MLHDEKRDSEQIRSAFSHSDDLRRLATFSTLQKNLLFTRSSKQGLGLSDPHLPPQAAQSPEIRFAGTSSSSSSVAVGSRGVGAWPGAGASYLPQGALCPRRETGAVQPAFGKLIIRQSSATDTENFARTFLGSAFTCC